MKLLKQSKKAYVVIATLALTCGHQEKSYAISELTAQTSAAGLGFLGAGAKFAYDYFTTETPISRDQYAWTLGAGLFSSFLAYRYLSTFTPEGVKIQQETDFAHLMNNMKAFRAESEEQLKHYQTTFSALNNRSTEYQTHGVYKKHVDLKELRKEVSALEDNINSYKIYVAHEETTSPTRELLRSKNMSGFVTDLVKKMGEHAAACKPLLASIDAATTALEKHPQFNQQRFGYREHIQEKERLRAIEEARTPEELEQIQSLEFILQEHRSMQTKLDNDIKHLQAKAKQERSQAHMIRFAQETEKRLESKQRELKDIAKQIRTVERDLHQLTGKNYALYTPAHQGTRYYPYAV